MHQRPVQACTPGCGIHEAVTVVGLATRFFPKRVAEPKKAWLCPEPAKESRPCHFIKGGCKILVKQHLGAVRPG